MIQLAPEWEEKFSQYQMSADQGGEIALPPEEINRLGDLISDRIAKASDTGAYPAIVTSSRRRRFLRTILGSKGIPNSVLSYDEIGSDAKPTLVGMVPA